MRYAPLGEVVTLKVVPTTSTVAPSIPRLVDLSVMVPAMIPVPIVMTCEASAVFPGRTVMSVASAFWYPDLVKVARYPEPTLTPVILKLPSAPVVVLLVESLILIRTPLRPAPVSASVT